MLKKTITYTDYNGVERTEDHYFNLNEAEMIELEAEIPGGFTEMLSDAIQKMDVPVLMRVFKQFMLKAYGQKSQDGRRFVKSKEITDSFVQTEAYSKLFMELFTDADAASAFFNALAPTNKPKSMPDVKTVNLAPATAAPEETKV